MDWHREANYTARLSEYVMAAVNTEKNPTVALDNSIAVSDLL